ncbi:hypothetical protein LG047_16520 [Methylocystis sp. WRRC1]|uniref:hypothetical protein n=1 Tax=Methylocystis sp. WRRC1 TaxID=1732014 RepID=UPI001D15866A|nr:hypothetical protein [Methylocystis sp. WRRC1]MCC3246900.1 hypothetical protein [Methylocystis sp. WRRC1]
MTALERKRCIELRMDRETAWAMRRVLLRFHRGAALAYEGRALSAAEERQKHLEYALADTIEQDVIKLMRICGWEEEDDAPRE